MTFREAYKNEMSAVRPGEDLILNILGKMREEVQNPTPIKLSERIRQIPPRYLASAAAGICIIVAAAVIIPTIMNSGEFSDLNNEMNAYGGASNDDAALEMENGDIGYDDGEMLFDEAVMITEEEYDGTAAVAESSEAEEEISADAPAPSATTTPTRGGVDRNTNEEPPEEVAADYPGEDSLDEDFNADVEDEDIIGDADDVSVEDSDDWSAFVNYDNFKDWPDESLWNSLTVEVKEWEAFEYDPALYLYDEDELEASPPLPEHVKTVIDFAAMFLDGSERRLSSFAYSIALDEGVIRRRFADFGGVDTDPIYSMLSKYMRRDSSVRELTHTDYDELWYNGIQLELFGGYNTVLIYVTPDDTLVLIASGYDGAVTVQMDEGEHIKLYSFLEALDK